MSPYENINIFGPQIPQSIGSGDPNYLLQTLGNVPSSAYQLGSDVAQVVTSPVQTLDAIGNLGLGLIALAIPDAYQEESLDKPQEAAMAVGQYISDRYGGLDKAKESLKTDPVGVLADVSGILLGGGYLATKSGLKVGELATKAGIATDPLVIAGKGASQVGKGITRRDVLKGTGAGLASLAVPMSMMTDVTKAIPPVAKSSGVLAGIGKFKGIIDNISPYLSGSKKREDILENMRQSDAKVGRGRYDIDPIRNNEAIRNVFDRNYPVIGNDSSFGLRVRTPKVINQMDQFGKQYNLKDSDFSIVNTEQSLRDVYGELTSQLDGGDFYTSRLFHERRFLPNEFKPVLDSSDELLDIARKLDNVPDKKVTSSRNTLSAANDKIIRHGTHNIEHRLTTGTVDSVPVMKVEYYREFTKGEMTKINEELFIPNESGLEKLSKGKQKKAKGGLVESIDIFQKNS
jgi:hypothetical protein|tara:strand:+ start:4778 stop:6154 length:1377 start_codon:yes stop_codon:yes gene_type:complete